MKSFSYRVLFGIRYERWVFGEVFIGDGHAARRCFIVSAASDASCSMMLAHDTARRLRQALNRRTHHRLAINRRHRQAP